MNGLSYMLVLKIVSVICSGRRIRSNPGGGRMRRYAPWAAAQAVLLVAQLPAVHARQEVKDHRNETNEIRGNLSEEQRHHIGLSNNEDIVNHSLKDAFAHNRFTDREKEKYEAIGREAANGKGAAINTLINDGILSHDGRKALEEGLHGNVENKANLEHHNLKHHWKQDRLSGAPGHGDRHGRHGHAIDHNLKHNEWPLHGRAGRRYNGKWPDSGHGYRYADGHGHGYCNRHKQGHHGGGNCGYGNGRFSQGRLFNVGEGSGLHGSRNSFGHSHGHNVSPPEIERLKIDAAHGNKMARNRLAEIYNKEKQWPGSGIAPGSSLLKNRNALKRRLLKAMRRGNPKARAALKRMEGEDNIARRAAHGDQAAIIAMQEMEGNGLLPHGNYHAIAMTAQEIANRDILASMAAAGDKDAMAEMERRDAIKKTMGLENDFRTLEEIDNDNNVLKMALNGDQDAIKEVERNNMRYAMLRGIGEQALTPHEIFMRKEIMERAELRARDPDEAAKLDAEEAAWRAAHPVRAAEEAAWRAAHPEEAAARDAFEINAQEIMNTKIREEIASIHPETYSAKAVAIRGAIGRADVQDKAIAAYMAANPEALIIQNAAKLEEVKHDADKQSIQQNAAEKIARLDEQHYKSMRMIQDPEGAAIDEAAEKEAVMAIQATALENARIQHEADVYRLEHPEEAAANDRAFRLAYPKEAAAQDAARAAAEEEARRIAISNQTLKGALNPMEAIENDAEEEAAQIEDTKRKVAKEAAISAELRQNNLDKMISAGVPASIAKLGLGRAESYATAYKAAILSGASHDEANAIGIAAANNFEEKVRDRHGASYKNQLEAEENNYNERKNANEATRSAAKEIYKRALEKQKLVEKEIAYKATMEEQARPFDSHIKMDMNNFYETVKLLIDEKKNIANKAIRKKRAIETMMQQTVETPVIINESQNLAKNKEEELAAAAKSIEVKKTEDIAFNNVRQLGGSLEEAKQEANKAGQLKRSMIEAEEEKQAAQLKHVLESQMDPSVANISARHLALAHAGRNPTGNSMNELYDNAKHAMNIDLGDSTNELKSVVRVIPDNVGEVSLKNAVLDLPLSEIPSIKAKTVEENQLKQRQKKLRDELRNKVTKEYIPSGLPVIKLEEDGYLNASESAKKIKIKNGKVFYTQAAYQAMKDRGIDTSALQPRFNDRKGPLPNTTAYYETELRDMEMNLSTADNPNPPRIVSNGNESVDISQASKIIINDGTLVSEPWETFSAKIRPIVYKNMSADRENVTDDARRMFEQQEMKNMSMKSSSVDVFNNPSGSSFVQITPAYGVRTHMTAQDAYNLMEKKNRRAKRSSDSAREKTPMNIAETEGESSAVEDFMNHGAKQALRYGEMLNSKNPINNSENKMLTPFTKKDANLRLRDGKTEADELFNMAMLSAPSIANTTEMSEEVFRERLEHIHPHTLNALIKYKRSMCSCNGCPDLLHSQEFVPELSSVFPKYGIARVYHWFYVFHTEMLRRRNIIDSCLKASRANPPVPNNPVRHMVKRPLIGDTSNLPYKQNNHAKNPNQQGYLSIKTMVIPELCVMSASMCQKTGPGMNNKSNQPVPAGHPQPPHLHHKG